MVFRIGKRIVLPSTFTGSRRYMSRVYHDAMAIVRQYGKPDLFITITTNPSWPEIKEQLLPHQKAQDRPDIVARVFQLKLDELILDLKKGIFGKLEAYVCTIEF